MNPVTIPGPMPSTEPATTSFWHGIRHPFFWVTENDLPRLRHNAQLPFWKSKFEVWRRELKALDQLEIGTKNIDFHIGTNKPALKAAMCWLVDDDDHYARLIGSFLSAVVQYYRNGPDWRAVMGTHGMGFGTGQNWGGLANNHIIDPQIWLSTGHLYDVICGKGFMSPEDEKNFEEMMAVFYQLSCLHEEMHKMDNNRSVWLSAGGYLSTLFDPNRKMADGVRVRLRDQMFRFLDTILEDGIHYEIGSYGPGTIAAMQVFARCIRGAEGIDFFKQKVEGVGFEEAYRAWVGTLIPGSSLRTFCSRDRINHWESICAGYLEYDIPEVGWAVSRIHERPWVPMFQHWPQGFEFYTYREPAADIHPPARRHSHFTTAGMAFLRSSWEADASSLYFRYGFQGSSHGGGLNKLNIELTCNDEPLIADPMLTESSQDKNVVIVDGQCQEQCSGRLLASEMNEDTPIQYVSALGGFGAWSNRSFLNDPRAEIHYWSTKHQECFPGRARMRRTVAQVLKHVYVVRDTLWSLDDAGHDYEWLFHTFANPDVGAVQERRLAEYTSRKLFYSQNPDGGHRWDLRYKVDYSALPEPALECHADKASLRMAWSVFGAVFPGRIGISHAPAPFAFNGSPETGDGLSQEIIHRLHLKLHGRNVAMTTVLVPRAADAPDHIRIGHMEDFSLDRMELDMEIDGTRHTVCADEATNRWECQSKMENS